MVLVNFFLRKKTSTTASIAKERLQIIVDERKTQHKMILHYLPELKHDLIQVIRKYVHDPQIISIQFKKKDADTTVLKCNVSITNKKYKKK